MRRRNITIFLFLCIFLIQSVKSETLVPRIVVQNFPTFSCSDSGKKYFDIFFENILTEFDVITISFLMEINNQKFDVSNSISCYPLHSLVSNQKVRCSIDVKDFLSKLPKCSDIPLLNKIHISSSTTQGNFEETIDVFFVKEGMANMHITDIFPSNFNCLTGTQFNINFYITHYGNFNNPYMSFSVNNSKKFKYIECSKIDSVTQENYIQDFYKCKINVYNTTLDNCIEGNYISIVLFAEKNKKEINASFNILLKKEEPVAKLSLTFLSNHECQIATNDEICIPKNPELSFHLHVNTNVGDYELDNIEYEFDGKRSKAVCDRDNDNYECRIFLPLEKSGPHKLKAYADLISMGYSKTLESNEITLNYVGKRKKEEIDTLKKLEEKKKDLEKMKNITKIIQRVLIISEWVSGFGFTCGPPCSDVKEIGELFKDEGVKGVVWEIFKSALYEPLIGHGNILEKLVKVSLTLLDFGAGCIGDELKKDVEKAIDNLKKFSEGENVKESAKKLRDEINNIDIIDYCKKPSVYSCIGKNLLMLNTQYLTGIGVGILVRAAEPYIPCIHRCTCEFVFLSFLCRKIKIPLPLIDSISISPLELIKTVANAALTFIAIYSFAIIMDVGNLQGDVILAQLENVKEMNDYQDKYYKFTIDTIVENTLIGTGSSNLFQEPQEMRFVIYKSGIELSDGDTVCLGDSIDIEYEFEKASADYGFVDVYVRSSSRGIVKTLSFGHVNGTVSYEVDDIFSTNNGNVISEPYTFDIDYGYSKSYFTLNYRNETC